jgi:glycosyltransferase involved in cell wall biosynthesis
MESRLRINRPLEIALLSTSAVSTPPVTYGGTELVIADLARALVTIGHRPTIFATGDSVMDESIPIRSTFARAVWPPDDLAELRHVTFAWKEIAGARFDVIHTNHAIAIPFTELLPGRPTVATLHHEHVERVAEHYAAYPDVAYVAISRRQRERSPQVPFRSVIHHGIDVNRYPEGRGDGGYCAFLGRFAPEKGPHLAIDAARRAGARLRIGGAAHPCERAFFEREVAPRFGADTEWLGEVGGERKAHLVAGASALLFPIAWEEPFGLVMIESMLAGTPVIAFRRGSVPEVVEEGVTGFIVEDGDVDAMADRIATKLPSFDRKRCRARARERWSSIRMARDYVALYERILGVAEAPRSTRREERPLHGHQHHGHASHGLLHRHGGESWPGRVELRRRARGPAEP